MLHLPRPSHRIQQWQQEGRLVFWTTLAALCMMLLSGCTQNQIDRLKTVGQEPAMNAVTIPQEKGAPISWPVMQKHHDTVQTSNSLWDTNARAFFKDMRASEVGDILTVKIAIADKAELDNKTERKRTSSDSLSVPSLFGLQGKAVNFLPGSANPTNLIQTTGNMDNAGEGLIEREETIETQIAAVITQRLPGGNFMIYGSQEIRVNHEIRQLTVEGVIRPRDISPSNIIDSNRIAEARISYGGKGLITDVQQPRVGNQIVDILSPW